MPDDPTPRERVLGRWPGAVASRGVFPDLSPDPGWIITAGHVIHAFERTEAEAWDAVARGLAARLDPRDGGGADDRVNGEGSEAVSLAAGERDGETGVE